MPHDSSALLNAPERTAWQGAWLWTAPVEAARNAYAFFRRTFRTEEAGTLELAITADSVYLLFVDGQVVGRGPARSPLAYYSFDRYALELPAGDHAIAVLVHHVGEVNATMMLGRPGLLADVQVVTAGGMPTDLSTDESWKALPAEAWQGDLPAMLSHFGFWEELDLRKLPAGWMETNFPDAAWPQATEICRPPCAPWARLVERDIPLPRYTELPVARIAGHGQWEAGPTAEIFSVEVAGRTRRAEKKDGALPWAVAPTRRPQGRYLTVDFGRTVSGYVELDVAESSPGQVLDISYDEMLTPEKAVNPERTYAHYSDRVVLPGGACPVRLTHPRGFRYVTLDLAPSSAPFRLTAVRAVEETYPFDLQGIFTSSELQLDKFAVKSGETVRICTTDAFTDCPTRERVQWTEDLYMHSQVAAYAFGDTAMLRRTLFQLAQGQLPDGRINGFSPSERTNCAFASSSLMWLHLLADYWLYSGDEAVRRLLPAAGRLLEGIHACQDGTGLIAGWPAGQFWDWAPVETAGCLLLTNAAYAMTLERLAAQPLFAELGDLAGEAARVRSATHARFWDTERGLYRTAVLPDGTLSPLVSQGANAVAVLAGVTPETERISLLRRSIDPARLGPVPVGESSLQPEMYAQLARGIIPVGTLWFGHFLCRTLFEAGFDTEALAQMRALWGAYDTLPTFPEVRVQAGNTGHCHGWAAGPAYLLPAYVLGLRPTGPGWGEATFAPHPGDLTWARGRVPTPHGLLEAGWRRDGDRLAVTLEVPAGVRVTARVNGSEAVVVGPQHWEE